MSKRLVWVLIGIMAVTLIGLILVQAYWIRDGIRLKKEQFGGLAQSALADVVEQLAHEETFYHITNEVTGLSSDSVVMRMDKHLSKSQLRKGQAGFSISLRGDAQGLHGSQEFFMSQNDTMVYDRNASQLPSDRVRDVDERMRKRLDNMAAQTRFVKQVVDRLVSVNTHIEEQINRDVLRNIIRKALKAKGITLDFEFAVSNPIEGTVFQTKHFAPRSQDPIYFTQLRPINLLTEGNYLSIQFRNEKDSLSNSLNLMTYTSVLLTLIILAIFSSTIYIILKQKKLSEIRTDFVNNMTHEFKTPISTIKLSAEMLTDESIPASAKNVVHIGTVIGAESQRLQVQVEKVLQTAVYENSRMKLKLVELDLNELASYMGEHFSIHVHKKNGSIHYDLQAENPFIVADEHHITNLINNLLDNALKYTRQTPEIHIATRDKRQAVELIITDNGIGMTKADQKRIFDQFYRVSTGNRHDVKGFGLGLSYVKKVVDAHGGIIRVESEPNKGTSFKILFPREHE